MEQSIINALTLGSVYTLVALGLTLIFGILDIANFAHGELYMLGGYFAFVLISLLNVPYLLAIPLAMVGLAAVGAVLDRFMFRPIRDAAPIVSIIATLGLSIGLQQLAVILWKADPREVPSPFSSTIVQLPGASLTLQGLLVILCSAALIAVLYLFIKKSRLGKAMRATAQDKLAASALGIDTNHVMMATVSIGSAIAAAAGCLIGPIFLVYPTMGVLPCLKAFVVVIIGGMGNVPGAIFGGYLLAFLETFVTGYVSSLYRDPIAFVVLILVLIVRPAGLFGTLERKA